MIVSSFSLFVNSKRLRQVQPMILSACELTNTIISAATCFSGKAEHADVRLCWVCLGTEWLDQVCLSLHSVWK